MSNDINTANKSRPSPLERGWGEVSRPSPLEERSWGKARSYIKIGIAGPVGSGKTALIEKLSRVMYNDYSIAVITNDIYTKEDAEFLTKNSLLPAERIIGVETGGCPHTAISSTASRFILASSRMAV